MKKKHYYILGALLLVSLFLGIWGCWHRTPSDCSTALPEDVSLVAKVNVKDLVMQNGMDLADIKNVFLSSDKSGVAYEANAYAFSARGYFGLVVPLDDKEQFLHTLSAHSSKIEKQRGLSWTTVSGSFLLVADDDKAMIVGPASASEQESLRNMLYTCMKQKSGGDKSKLTEQVKQSKEPIALASHLSFVPETYQGSLKSLLPEHVHLDDLSLMAQVTVHQNEIKISLGLGAERDKARKFLDALDESFIPLDGSLCKTTPNSSFMQLMVGLDGKRFLEVLRQNPEIRTKLLAANLVFDLDMIMNSVKGDVSLTLPSFTVFNQPLYLQVHITDDAFMQHVSSWNEGTSKEAGVMFVPARNDNYLCAYNDKAYYFGTREHRLFVSTDESYALSLPKTPSELDKICPEHKVYGTLDLSSLMDMLSFLPKHKALMQMQKMTFSCKNVKEWTITLEASKDMDLVKSLIKE